MLTQITLISSGRRFIVEATPEEIKELKQIYQQLNDTIDQEYSSENVFNQALNKTRVKLVKVTQVLF